MFRIFRSFQNFYFFGFHAATNHSESSFKIKISWFDSVLLFPTWFTGDIRHREHAFKGILYFFRALQFGCHSAIGSVHSVCYAPSHWLYWWFLELFAFVGSTAYFFTNQIQIYFFVILLVSILYPSRENKLIVSICLERRSFGIQIHVHVISSRCDIGQDRKVQ